MPAKLLSRDRQAEFGEAVVDWGRAALKFLETENWTRQGFQHFPREECSEPDRITVRDGRTSLSFQFRPLREPVIGDLHKVLGERRKKVRSIVTTLLQQADPGAKKRFRQACEEVGA